MFLIFVVISMLAFDTPTAKADETVLTLSLPTDLEEEAAPGTEIVAPLTIVDGYDSDEVEVVQIVIEYDSSVVSVADPRIAFKGIPSDGDIVLDVLSFGILTGWTHEAGVTPPEETPQLPNAEWLKIGLLKGSGDPLLNPGLPAELLTIKFTVESSVATSTDLLFINDKHTFFARSADKLLLDGDTQNGLITLTEPPPPSPVILSMPTIVIPIAIGETEGVMPLNVVDGYTADDQIEVVQIVVEYDSSVVTVADPPTIGFKGITDGDIVIDVLSFGILTWTHEAGVVPPEKTPQLPNAEWLKIGLLKGGGDPLQNPGLPAELLTIKFTAHPDAESTDKTRVLFINEEDTYFAKGDGTKLPVDLLYDPPGPEDDPYGDIALPVELSALGAIWHPNGTKIFWEAASQRGNLGWNVYRSETKDGKFVKINGELIKGAGTTANPMKYSFIDKDAEKGEIYYYYLEDISFNGEKHRTDAIKSIPVNKITSWGAIKNSVSH